MLTRVPLEEDLAHRFKDNVLWEVILRDTDSGVRQEKEGS